MPRIHRNRRKGRNSEWIHSLLYLRGGVDSKKKNDSFPRRLRLQISSDKDRRATTEKGGEKEKFGPLLPFWNYLTKGSGHR